MGHREHKRHRYSLRIGVITVSSTRSEENDESGRILMEEIERNSHRICEYAVVKDDKIEILATLFKFLRGCDAVIVNGGTGISSRDVSYESIAPNFDKELNGFGEVFRRVSYDEIGTAAMMSRATAGVISGKLVFVTPGSPNAVRTASRLIFSEIEHMWYEVHKEANT